MAEQMKVNSDALLDILGNDTRRKILAILSEGPMYFNQLAKEIGIGQQAVIRHMRALERSGLIEAYAEKSKYGAPDRKYYRLNSSFVLTISLSEDNFTIANKKIVESRLKESREHYKAFDATPEENGEALHHLQDSLKKVEQEIAVLEYRLNDLYALKQLILSRLHQIGTSAFSENERRILYKIIEESPKSIEELSDMLDERESILRETIADMKGRVETDFAKLLFEDID